MSKSDSKNPPPQLSEVGLVLAQQDQPSNDLKNNPWHLMFEMQNANMQALIEAIRSPAANSLVELPEFDPDNIDTDARSWCAIVDQCFGDKPLQGDNLVVAICKALKGAASIWLSQAVYHGMTWTEFKILFKSKFISKSTLAGDLVDLQSDKPSDQEPLVAYASRLITSLTDRWKDVSKEHIVIATVLAHMSQFDPRLQRMAFTSDITSKDRLQQELLAISHLKRKMNTPDESSHAPDTKRPKFSVLECFSCGNLGNKCSECPSKGKDITVPASTSTALREAVQQPAVMPLVCNKRSKPGVMATHCISGVNPADGSVTSHNEVCIIRAFEDL